jgi:hypothetical protein
MAKDKKDKDRDRTASVKAPAERGTAGAEGTGGKGGSGAADAAGGQHHAAKAHGSPTQVDTSLPATRSELMVLHAAARARRNSAPLGGETFRAAVDELARIEVRIAAIDRAQDPPLG